MHVKLIDANSLGYAQHHAHDIRWVGDLQAQAIEGVLQHLRRSLYAEPSTLHVCLWDGRAQWRYDLHPGYKSGRHRTAEQRQAREHYERQRVWIQKALSYLPVVQVTHPAAEADDLAWGLSQALGGQGHLVSLYTADTDWLQLVRPRVRWLNARKSSAVVEMDNFHRASGYAHPTQVAEVKALTGDSSDDIDGLPDIALKRASALLGKYGSLRKVLEAAEDFLAFSQEPKYFQSLCEEDKRLLVERNFKLVNLQLGPRLLGTDVKVEVGAYNEEALQQLVIDLEFHVIYDSFGRWKKPFEQALSKPDVLSFQRAVQTIEKSWVGE